MPKFETKNALDLKKISNILEISTVKFVKFRNFTKTQKRQCFGPQMPYSGIFGL